MTMRGTTGKDVRMATELLPEVLQGDPETQVAFDVACLRTGIVNVFLVGTPGAADREWVLVDAGMTGFADRILDAAEARFGDARPACIVLTHAHFDHVGCARELSEAWGVPIYANVLELPYLTGRSAYPPPDPTVGGGFFSLASVLFPRSMHIAEERVRALPSDGSVPGMPGWQWIHTPGHTAGHVSFWREEDRTLIAGDAFVTTRQESLLAVLEQRPEMHGPPMYFTQDWDAARRSVQTLAELEPEAAATGHGTPMRGPVMREALDLLARDFETLAVPRDGRYVRAPALADERGTVSIPPPVHNHALWIGAAAALALGIYVGTRNRRR
jgi:glyoxylase-like metal-dependent hydrolase (beta-lactamase superfamily II)